MIRIRCTKRCVFNVLALLPLVLLLAICAWSYWPVNWHIHFDVLRGNFFLSLTDRPNEGTTAWRGVVYEMNTASWRWDWQLAGFRSTLVRRPGSTYSTRVIAIPLYAPTLAAAALTGYLLFIFNRQQSRINTFQCQNCGYDLRASPDRCPECGAVAETDA